MIIVSREKNTELAEFKRFNACKAARLAASRASLELESGLASALASVLVCRLVSAWDLGWAAGSETESHSAPGWALPEELRRAHLQSRRELGLRQGLVA